MGLGRSGAGEEWAEEWDWGGVELGRSGLGRSGAGEEWAEEEWDWGGVGLGEK